MRIMFMGTPDFARESLRAIYESGEEIVAVVTTEDKPRGRGMVLTPTPVKQFALEKGLDVYQPKTLKDTSFQEVLEKTQPELIIVVAYGKLLPEYVIDFPRYACINSHASILPKYRGAAPIQRAIMDGESKTGVSVMKMDVGLDTGDVILVEEVEISIDDNFESVHDKLIEASQKGLLRAIKQFKEGRVVYTRQENEFTYAQKITKEDCLIDFSDTVLSIHNKIRGLSPIPLAFTRTAEGRLLKLTRAHIGNDTSGEIGEVVSLDGSIGVKCKDGVILIDELIPEGKGKMSAQAYINGRKIKLGDMLK